MSGPLPEFERPPLVEVVCGLQFAPLELLTAHLGDFWQLIRDGYTTFEDQPPLPNMFDDPKGTRIEREHSFDMPPLRRVFFVNEARNFLLQVAPTRFLSNWRRLSDDDAYPRFDTTYTKLVETSRQFREYVSSRALGPLRLNQYELSYVNHVPQPIEQGPEFFTFWRAPVLPERYFEPTLRTIDTRFQARLQGIPGSLTVSLKHGERASDGRPTFSLDLTARGAAESDGADRDGWFSRAHEAIVESFATLTTAKAHAFWGRTR